MPDSSLMSAQPLFRFFDLEGRTLLITGPTRGIGRAMLPELLEQGLSLVLVGRGQERLEAIRMELGADVRRVRVYDCDLSDSDAVRATAGKIDADVPELDFILHNAAVDPRKAFEEADEAFWHHVFQVNLFSSVTLTRRLLPKLRQSPQGRILFTGSVMEELGGALLTAYAATKGAITAVTRSLAHECKGTALTVNAVIPGAIQVEKEALSQEIQEALVEMQTVSRRLVPADLLGAVCLLLSRAGGAITAQTLVIDGGLLQPLADPNFRKTLEARRAIRSSGAD